jgi:hypothetical protein
MDCPDQKNDAIANSQWRVRFKTVSLSNWLAFFWLFFLPQKKVTKGKNAVKGKPRFTEMTYNLQKSGFANVSRSVIP